MGQAKIFNMDGVELFLWLRETCLSFFAVLRAGRDIFTGPGLHEYDLHGSLHRWVCIKIGGLPVQGKSYVK